MAHDFNNLLGVVGNNAHLIGRHPSAPELQMQLSSIHRAVAVGSQLTQHLLRFAGQRPVQPRRIELGRYLHDVRELMHSVLGQRIAVIAEVAADTHRVRIDPAEFELALINLALNARDAMPNGGELRLRARNALPDETEGLAGHPECEYVLITVDDDGSGVDPELTERVFEPFFTTKPVGKGTGLGLSQVLGFCVQAGGTARLASTPGLGTTVSLLLPATPRAEVSDEPAPPASAAAPAALSGLRVLLVEDNEELAETSAALLRAHGLQVQRAANAAQALQQLAPPHAIDVVLSDVVMPGEMDGLMLARRLQHEQPGLAVVLVSGYSDASARAAEIQLLRKPYGEDQLLQAIAQALAAARRQRPEAA